MLHLETWNTISYLSYIDWMISTIFIAFSGYLCTASLLVSFNQIPDMDSENRSLFLLWISPNSLGFSHEIYLGLQLK